MAKVITVDEQERMFQVYIETRSIRQTALKCNRSPVTVIRYKRLNRWVDRIKEIDLEALKISHQDILSMRIQQLKDMRLIQKKARELVQSKTKITVDDMDLKDAFNLLIKASQEERVILGDPRDILALQGDGNAGNYDTLIELLQDPDFRALAERILPQLGSD